MPTAPVENETEPTLRVMPYPKDTNPAGDIFGGWIMSQVDIAGSIAAYKKAKSRVVTVAVNAFSFHKPVFVGDVVSFYTSIKKIGNSSLTVAVTVYAERGWIDPEIKGNYVKVTEAELTYVSIDENRRPRPVPK